jgi:hypothetical protein
VDSNVSKLETAGASMALAFKGARLQDVALNAIEIIDRNLYERSCDVRWWATDSAVVDVLEAPSVQSRRHASRRLATILRAYTVYLDLWVVDAEGRVIANGRPEKYPQAQGASVAHEPWFQDAVRSRSGDDFTVADIARNSQLGDAPVATYAAAIREGGEVHGRPLGVLGIFFDWAPQAKAVVAGVGLGEEERRTSRVMLVDAGGRVIASSEDDAHPDQAFKLPTDAGPRGYYVEQDRLVAYALTPGYETYEGLGWYGVIEHRLGGRC